MSYQFDPAPDCRCSRPQATRPVLLTRATGQTLRQVDECIAPIVEALQQSGLLTTSSCCGHGDLPGEILLADGRIITVTKNTHAPGYQPNVGAFPLFPANQGD